MKKSSIAILILTLLIPILIISFFITLPKNKDNNSIALNPNPDCNIITYNGDNKINLVFFASKEDTITYSTQLLSTSPLDNNLDAFNIFYISPDKYDPECELYKNIALLCYSKEIIKHSSVCPNDYIITIKSQPSNIRSAAYMNTMSINSNLPKTVLAHEFGHAFANLAEEYTPANIPKGSKNCASKCEEFNNIENCYQGCSKSEYYRSIENGIMKTLSSNNFGDFNEKLIIEEITKQSSQTNSFFTSNAVLENPDCNNKKYYLINANYSNGNIILNDKTIQKGCIGNSGTGPFNINLEKKDGSILYLGDFNPEIIFTDSQDEQESEISGGTFISDKEFFLKIPIIPDSKNVNIIKEKNTINKISLNDIGRQLCISQK